MPTAVAVSKSSTYETVTEGTVTEATDSKEGDGDDEPSTPKKNERSSSSRSNRSVLSPSITSPSTRSQNTARKRKTPEKYIPTMVSTVKSPIKKSKTTSSSSEKGVSSLSVSPVKQEKDEKRTLLRPSPSHISSPSNTVVEILDDEPSVLDSKMFQQLERDSIMKKSQADLEPDNSDVVLAAELSERRFLKSMFEIKTRNDSRITWAGYLLGYIREIHLNERGKEYMKTRK